MSENIILQNEEENIIVVTFNITAENTTIQLSNLTGASQVNWGDGNINNNLTHVYTLTGEYTCKIFDVTLIGESAFEKNTSLTSIEIPDNVTSIGLTAFLDCSNLTSVVIGNGVTAIEDSAFAYCNSLMSITVSESNMTYQSMDGNLYSKDGTVLIQYAIGKTATEFVIPDKVTSIGDDAFLDCLNLTSVKIPDSVRSIGHSAFYNCTSLTSVIIPDSVIEIGISTFEACSSLTSVEIPDSVTSIVNSAFKACSSLTSVEIPDSVTSIGWEAFYGCSSLTSVVIGEKVNQIEVRAFGSCNKLARVTFKGKNPIQVGMLYELTNYNTLTYYVPKDSVEVYRNTWSSVVAAEQIQAGPDEDLINLEGLKTYHKALKAKYLDNKLDIADKEIMMNNLNSKLDKIGGAITGDLSIGGNLTVAGTTTTQDTETVLVKNNIVVTNSDGLDLIEPGGFAIKTDKANAYGIMYVPGEGDNKDGVKIGLGGFTEDGKFTYNESQAQFLATRADSLGNGNLPQWDNVKKQFVDSGAKIGDCVKFTDLAGQSKAGVVYKAANNEIMAGRFNYYIDAYYLPFGVKYSLTNPSERDVWTDDDKAKACKTLGAVHTTNGKKKIYGTDHEGNQTQIDYHNSMQGNYIVQRNGDGSIQVPDINEKSNDVYAVNYGSMKAYVGERLGDINAALEAILGV